MTVRVERGSSVQFELCGCMRGMASAQSQLLVRFETGGKRFLLCVSDGRSNCVGRQSGRHLCTDFATA